MTTEQTPEAASGGAADRPEQVVEDAMLEGASPEAGALPADSADQPLGGAVADVTAQEAPGPAAEAAEADVAITAAQATQRVVAKAPELAGDIPAQSGADLAEEGSSSLSVAPVGEEPEDLAARLTRAQQEVDVVRTDLNRQITNLTLKLDEATLQASTDNQLIARLQDEVDELRTENTRLNGENVQLKEDQDIYKQVGEGHEDAVQKLLDRAETSEARAESADRQVKLYLFMMLLVLLLALAAVGVATLLVLTMMR